MACSVSGTAIIARPGRIAAIAAGPRLDIREVLAPQGLPRSQRTVDGGDFHRHRFACLAVECDTVLQLQLAIHHLEAVVRNDVAMTVLRIGIAHGQAADHGTGVVLHHRGVVEGYGCRGVVHGLYGDVDRAYLALARGEVLVALVVELEAQLVAAVIVGVRLVEQTRARFPFEKAVQRLDVTFQDQAASAVAGDQCHASAEILDMERAMVGLDRQTRRCAAILGVVIQVARVQRAEIAVGQAHVILDDEGRILLSLRDGLPVQAFPLRRIVLAADLDGDLESGGTGRSRTFEAVIAHGHLEDPGLAFARRLLVHPEPELLNDRLQLLGSEGLAFRSLDLQRATAVAGDGRGIQLAAQIAAMVLEAQAEGVTVDAAAALTADDPYGKAGITVSAIGVADFEAVSLEDLRAEGTALSVLLDMTVVQRTADHRCRVDRAFIDGRFRVGGAATFIAAAVTATATATATAIIATAAVATSFTASFTTGTNGTAAPLRLGRARSGSGGVQAENGLGVWNSFRGASRGCKVCGRGGAVKARWFGLRQLARLRRARGKHCRLGLDDRTVRAWIGKCIGIGLTVEE